MRSTNHSVVLTACAIAAVVITGCGGGGGASAPAPAAPPSESGGGGSVQTLGALVVQTAAGSLSTLTLQAPSDEGYAFVGLYGATISRLEYRPASGKLVGRDFYGRLGVSNINGGSFRTILDTGGSHPRWSPDGRQIAFYRSTTLYICKADGSEVHPIVVPSLTDITGLCWSADGNYLYIGADDGGGKDIWRVSLGSFGSVRLTEKIDTGGADYYPDISPDGRMIAWIKDDNLVIMPLDGDPATDMVTVDASGDCGWPRWSPDGRYIAYKRSGAVFTGDIWVYDTLSGTTSQLTAGHYDTYPDWSPDSQYVLFCRISLIVGDLYRVPVGGSPGDEELLQSEWGRYPDSWAPAGGRCRVLIGPDGADWGGNNPPFGDSKPAAIVAYSPTDYGGAVALYTGGATVTLTDRSPSMVSPVAVCQATASQIRNVYQDRGPGVQRLNMSLEQDGQYPSTVLLTFNPNTALLTSVIPVFEPASTTAAGERVRVEAADGRLVISGAPMTVIDPASGRKLTDAPVYRVVLDEEGRPLR